MSEAHSVSDLLQRLEGDRSEAAHQIWDQFIHRLIGAARKHLKNLPRRAVDEEDVALSAFDAFFRGVQERRFHRLET
ncbi:MAG: RNA polymerase subunit sigma-70, partial [Pirellulales bacterium]|nr:RNA polymerase subunit sigma-70 [Pirellulales bacterium]